ncbi:hypothetical protein [Janibacter sp. GXQ6167]|uniref:hypothetical protein n=1 Tax=Janibacter sp. GXQ6167 TaxID=3240791 RepID=UPI003525D1AA
MPPHPPRPRLTRPIQILRRPDGTIQLGLGPHDALRVVGVAPHECLWLLTLDGSRSVDQACDDAIAHGMSPDRARHLLTHLGPHGLLGEGRARPLDDPPVIIQGAGQVPALLAEVLRQAGLSRVLRDPTGDAAVLPSSSPDGERAMPVVVIASHVPVAATSGDAWRAAGASVLPLWCGPGHASIGPLVLPGVGPCLHCLELTRVDLDPGWPWLRAQVSAPRVGPPVPVDGDGATCGLAAGLAGVVVLDHLAGRGLPLGSSIDVTVPGPTLARRVWHRHPLCDCADTPLGQGAPRAMR